MAAEIGTSDPEALCPVELFAALRPLMELNSVVAHFMISRWPAALARSCLSSAMLKLSLAPVG